MGLKSTMCRYPPFFFGSKREDDTYGVGESIYLIAPSRLSLGRSSCLQNINSSSLQVGLLLKNVRGCCTNGRSTPLLIQRNIFPVAPDLAQNFTLERT